MWRQYCSWLVQIEVMESDPTFNMKAPRLPERLPKALPQEPLNHILDHAPVDDELDVRDKAMFELMYGSGLRLSEIQGLNLDGIVLDEGWVSVKGKGGKQRQVPLVGKSIAALRDYWRCVLPKRASRPCSPIKRRQAGAASNPKTPAGVGSACGQRQPYLAAHDAP